MFAMKIPVGEVVDLFCGVGALSHGLLRAGFEIRAGYDIDSECKFAFETNNKAPFFSRDVSKLLASEIRTHFTGKVPSVLAGCAPCQPFSSYKQRYEEDPQWSLVAKFAKLAVGVQPDYVTMENVPALLRYKDGKVFAEFEAILRKGGYEVSHSVARCEDFGVPQKRRRLVVVASRKGAIPVLSPGASSQVTVRDAIGQLPAVAAGAPNPKDPLHVASALSPLNLQRIRSSKPGGTWRDWPKELRAACHRRSTGQSYPGVYARMEWDSPSPTMTTQCYGYGNGRFGHPFQDRGITLREAAILQSFPRDYQFIPAGQRPTFTKVGRWIGNAVPVGLAEAIGFLIRDTEGKYKNDRRS